MRRYVPYLGDTAARRAWDKLFSREVLGSMVVAGTLGKAIEKVILLFFHSTLLRLCAWLLALLVAVALFVWWHRVEDAAQAAKEKAEDAAEGDA